MAVTLTTINLSIEHQRRGASEAPGLRTTPASAEFAARFAWGLSRRGVEAIVDPVSAAPARQPASFGSMSLREEIPSSSEPGVAAVEPGPAGSPWKHLPRA
jgi:hypothetical protein